MGLGSSKQTAQNQQSQNVNLINNVMNEKVLRKNEIAPENKILKSEVQKLGWIPLKQPTLYYYAGRNICAFEGRFKFSNGINYIAGCQINPFLDEPINDNLNYFIKVTKDSYLQQMDYLIYKLPKLPINQSSICTIKTHENKFIDLNWSKMVTTYATGTDFGLEIDNEKIDLMMNCFIKQFPDVEQKYRKMYEEISSKNNK
jgi:hypothetical protein